MQNIYLTEFERVARTAFSMWDRDPASPSFGSFDRMYWGWKFKDFGDATLQYAVRLAAEYAIRTSSAGVLPPLLDGFVSYLKRIQHRDGSFDQCYPHERTPGVVYDILSTLIYVRRSPFLTSERSQRDLDDITARAVEFSLRTDEKHGEVANHIAEFAYELLEYAAFAGHERARSRANAYLDRLLSLFNREEGWFREYNGPDAGYQTRTLRYVTKSAALLGDAELWKTAAKATDFLELMLMPDGSAHPLLGVRSTALVYPSPFELLAARDARYSAIAERVRSGWERGRVPLPSAIDFQNAIRLADDAREAGIATRAGHRVVAGGEAKHEASVNLASAGILIRRSADTVVYVAYRLGGSVVAYVRKPEPWSLAFEDAGYVLRAEGHKPMLSRVPGGSDVKEQSGDRLVIEGSFYESLHEDVTPAQFVVLRVLNYTLLRVQWVADLFRRVVVRRLMSRRPKTRVTLRREIRFDSTGLTISDRIGSRTSVDGTMYRCRRATGVHMASSRYFQEDEVRDLPVGWMEPVSIRDGEPIVRSIQLVAANENPRRESLNASGT